MSGSGKRTGTQQVRIIGGRWRGRKLDFDPAEGLRPTGDRIRETLFNWLAGNIEGACCADLFAGTGALGLEALSRGAAHCDFVDNSRTTIARVTEHLRRLGTPERGSCHAGSALQFLQDTARCYDIVFIDPPFKLQLASEICAALDVGGRVQDQSLIYIESAAGDPPPQVPEDWRLHRDKVSGGVAYRLFRVDRPLG